MSYCLKYSVVQTALHITCDVGGHPPPTVTWLHSMRISTDANARIHTSPDNVLSFEPLEEGDTGEVYTCLACNVVGCVVREFLIIAVYPGMQLLW